MWHILRFSFIYLQAVESKSEADTKNITRDWRALHQESACSTSMRTWTPIPTERAGHGYLHLSFGGGDRKIPKACWRPSLISEPQASERPYFKNTEQNKYNKVASILIEEQPMLDCQPSHTHTHTNTHANTYTPTASISDTFKNLKKNVFLI